MYKQRGRWHSAESKWTRDLDEANGEDGVGSAADMVHACAGSGTPSVALLHQLADLSIVLNMVPGEGWTTYICA